MEAASTGRVRETILSRKPRKNSKQVAGLTVLIVAAVSVAAWLNGSALLPTLAATGQATFELHEYWRLLTAVFVHADLLHLSANILFLGVFAYLIHGYYGFWVFPVLCLALAALTNYLTLTSYPPHTSLVGASGLVYCMAGFWLWMYLEVERTLSLGKRFLRVFGVILILLLPTSYEPRVSYRAHGIGFALGALAAAFYFKRNGEWIRAAEVWEIDEPDEEANEDRETDEAKEDQTEPSPGNKWIH